VTTLAIASWPVLALILFARLPVTQAVIWAILLPYLFLPEAFAINLPGLPDISKSTVIALGVLLGLFFYRKRSDKTAEQAEQLIKGNPSLLRLLWTCMAVLILGNILTVLTNSDNLVYGDRFIPAAKPWDAFTQTILLPLATVPFWAGLYYLGAQRVQQALLKALVLGSLAYTVLMLVEIRLSPQLHFWVYGYYQHSFVQHIRDGFRPMVFMEHGLWVGFFTFTGFMAALGLWKSTKNRKWVWAALWIFAVLLISKNVGALIIAITLGGAYLVLNNRLQMIMVTALAAIILIFPTLRQSNILSTDLLAGAASIASPERAGSLTFRLMNEDLLLDKAAKRPLFGWGGWGRSRVYNESGVDISVTDGRWIIVLGARGWVGYVAFFGLFIFPLILLNRTRKRKDVPPETLALAMIGTGNLIYMIPNATLTPVGLVVFGAVAGFLVYDRNTTSETEGPQPPRSTRKPRYTRGPGPGARDLATAPSFSRKGSQPVR